MSFKRIDINEIKDFHFGNAQDIEGGTGCTAIISEKGAVCGVDVRGGGPATRETDLLKSENTVDSVNAVVLSGGSAFGLEASCGVMRELSTLQIGFPMKDKYIPIVCGASLYDLEVGSSDVFPDIAMGVEATKNAFGDEFKSGVVGAGTGASVGKICGPDRAMKTGLGVYACADDRLQVGAIAAVNAIGDIHNGSGRMIAGVLTPDGNSLDNTIKYLREMINNVPQNSEKESVSNTTISCVVTNAKLTKAQANKLASTLHDAYARSIKPVHSTLDGDTIFVMASGEVEVNFDALAALATDILQYSIIDGADSAKDAYGLKASGSII